MKIDGSVALVTGANRGLGRVYARELVRRGAAKVYGAARDSAAVTEPGVTPVALGITDPERVAQAAMQCSDASLLVNNAETWLSTVRTEMTIRSAISRFDSRRPMAARISASRTVTPAAARRACPVPCIEHILANRTDARSVPCTDAAAAVLGHTRASGLPSGAFLNRS
jgi:NAD(P)-dependent dehydrogenase (short-subunit alcohol dehydrogenase family)